MSRELATLPMVCVVWDDAHGQAGGEYTAEDIVRDYHQPVVCRSFGLLIHDDAKGVTIASEITNPEADDEPTYRGLGFIPRGMLKELIVLGVPKRPAAKRSKITNIEES